VEVVRVGRIRQLESGDGGVQDAHELSFVHHDPALGIGRNRNGLGYIRRSDRIARVGRGADVLVEYMTVRVVGKACVEIGDERSRRTPNGRGAVDVDEMLRRFRHDRPGRTGRQTAIRRMTRHVERIRRRHRGCAGDAPDAIEVDEPVRIRESRRGARFHVDLQHRRIRLRRGGRLGLHLRGLGHRGSGAATRGERYAEYQRAGCRQKNRARKIERVLHSSSPS